MIYISKQSKSKISGPSSLKIWITEGTSDSYKPLIEGFKKYAPEYNNTEFIIEKQTSDADRYRTLLLSTLTERSGPDIFMLHSGEDAILETKIEPIPSDLLDFSDFDKRYDDLFQWLLSSTLSWGDKISTLKWVPLGYETLGVFYNKSLIREVPKTWNDLEILYTQSTNGIFPSNLGLGPTYTPNMVDVVPLWFIDAWAMSYTDVSSGKNGLQSYLKYGSLKIGNESWDTSIITANTMEQNKSSMLEKKNNTLDMFMQWNIALVIGYPSLVLELEKSAKRVGSSIDGVILTDRLPQTRVQSASNLWRYSYFGISKRSENGLASIKFLEYLMTPEAQRLYMQEYPYIIPAQVEFYTTAEKNPLSKTFARTKLASFIPNIGEKISVFEYGLKSRFERYIREGIDSSDNPNIDHITDTISRDISCEIKSSIEWSSSWDCTSE
jgi:maltose-binding protein MalE